MKYLKLLIVGIAFLMMAIGGCGVMNEQGNVQPIAIAIALAGALLLLILSGDSDVYR